MNDPAETRAAAATAQPKIAGFLLAAIPFAATFAAGFIVTAVAGLLVYANVADVKSRDFAFLMVCMAGSALSAIAGYIAMRRSTAADQVSSGAAVSLLRKYRRAVVQAGADKEAGQYNIGEGYLRQLLGRRGA